MRYTVIYLTSNQYSAMLHTSIGLSVLVLGIGIARGQYYWVLAIGCIAWYRSNST